MKHGVCALQVAPQDVEDADQLQYHPKPGALIPKVGLENGSQGRGNEAVYRPPKLNPVSMMEDPDKVSNRDRSATRKARKSLRSDIIRELAREVHDMPEEVSTNRS